MWDRCTDERCAKACEVPHAFEGIRICLRTIKWLTSVLNTHGEDAVVAGTLRPVREELDDIEASLGQFYAWLADCDHIS